MEVNEKLHFMMTLNQISCLRPAERIQLFELLRESEKLKQLSNADVMKILGRRVNKISWNPEEAMRKADRLLRGLEHSSIGLIGFDHPEYPRLLKEIYDPPLVLFYRGTWPQWEQMESIAMVGTRFPTGSARSGAFDLAKNLAARGLGIISGLAKGVDKECHLGALSSHGFTAAVLGNGIDRIYPSVCEKTGYRILENGGLIISEYAPGTPPLKHHFPARNRIVSGLCRGTLLIQAPNRSGALITADYALDQGRDLFVYSRGVNPNNGIGGQKLAETGAPVIDRAEDILREWNESIDFQNFDDSSESKPLNEGFCIGQEMARNLEMELNGQSIRHNGSSHRLHRSE